ncbi:hypothetical protein AT6N2_C0269 [Agrobacterium tumefaciens]|nr:hypothetical protein AT6N2_C0269 [Agrobacterium tumefaciens]
MRQAIRDALERAVATETTAGNFGTQAAQRILVHRRGPFSFSHAPTPADDEEWSGNRLRGYRDPPLGVRDAIATGFQILPPRYRAPADGLLPVRWRTENNRTPLQSPQTPCPTRHPCRLRNNRPAAGHIDLLNHPSRKNPQRLPAAAGHGALPRRMASFRCREDMSAQARAHQCRAAGNGRRPLPAYHHRSQKTGHGGFRC